MNPPPNAPPLEATLGGPPSGDPRAQFRYAVYILLIAISAGGMTGRVMSVNSVDKIALENRLKADFLAGKRSAWRLQRPFLSANDRSRWATVRSLVELGTYEIDAIVDQPNWDTIDMVMHKNRQGEMRRYSSKPPLLATLVAGIYWVIHRATGADLETYPYDIGRAILFLINVVPLIVYFLVLARLAERLGGTDWGRLFMMGAATFGTYLTTYAVTFNNHLPAAICTAIAAWSLVRIWLDNQRGLHLFVIAGLSAAFAAANDLPALALFAGVSVVLAWLAPLKTLLAYAPAALVVAAAFFGTNYLAHDSLRVPYMHRSKTDPADNWYDYEYRDAQGRLRESYWRAENKVELDRGEPSVAVYAFHVLVGHHGIFSLTPIWLFSVAGAGMWLRAGPGKLRLFTACICLLTVVVVGYFIARPLEDRNYGGMATGFRWVFWLIPLWLILLLPAADWLGQRRWGRALALVALAASVLSVAYPTWNPWTYPWIMQSMVDTGWMKLE